MKYLNLILFLLVLSCNVEYKPIDYGSDLCHFCKMTVVDKQHAAELVTTKGKVHFFDAIECMVHYIGRNPANNYAFLLVNDYEKPGELIDAQASYYLISQAIPSPMGAFLSAFESEQQADKMQQLKGGQVFSWTELQKELNGEIANK